MPICTGMVKEACELDHTGAEIPGTRVSCCAYELHIKRPDTAALAAACLDHFCISPDAHVDEWDGVIRAVRMEDADGDEACPLHLLRWRDREARAWEASFYFTVEAA